LEEFLDHGEFGDIYNMGSGSTIKIYDLAKKIGELMGYQEITIEFDEKRTRPWEIWYLQSDNTKIDSIVNYRNKFSLEDGLRETIKFFKENGNKWDF
jgi:nucleoside-diphosphate-sugar epimerase